MAVIEKKAPMPQQLASPIFSRHETFPPRNGWLKKAFDACVDDSEIFGREEASITLGVGKNMAKAIRYWALAFKICQETTDKETKLRTIQPTNFGQLLLGDDGWDPYLEDAASLWLLHWNLLKKTCIASTWWFAFNNYRHPEFTQEDFLSELSAYIKQTWSESDFSEATLKNDVSCLVRMYCKDDSGRHISEETICSPFADLNLLTKHPGSRHISFQVGSKSSLPDAIVAAASLDYADQIRTSESTINISQLLYGLGSPGLVFKISESALCSALENIAGRRKDVVISDTGGIVQLQFSGQPAQISEKILHHFYTQKGS